MFAYCPVALLLLGSMLGSELVPALLPLLSLSSLVDPRSPRSPSRAERVGNPRRNLRGGGVNFLDQKSNRKMPKKICLALLSSPLVPSSLYDAAACGCVLAPSNNK